MKLNCGVYLVLAIGADHSYGTVEADDLRQVADNVTSAVITGSGHWIMEEQPAQAVKIIAAFVDEKQIVPNN